MKKFLFVSLLTGLFTTGCTLDNNTLNTVNTAMNVLGQATSNNEQANSVQSEPCKTKGWQDAYLKKLEDDGNNEGISIVKLQIRGKDVEAYDTGSFYKNFSENMIGTNVKVKLRTNQHNICLAEEIKK